MDNVNEVAKGAQREVQAARRPWYSILSQTRFLLAVYLIFLALFGGLAFLVYVHPLLPVDVVITHEFQENQAPWLSTFMIAVSYLGNTIWLFVGLIVLTAVAFWAFRLRLEAVTLAFICLTCSLLNVLVKLLVARPRPTQPLVDVIQHATGNSFPSGHVMSYVAYWGTLFTFSLTLFSGKRWWRIALLVISGLFVILVGPSRIYLGDHWASDVLGGYLLAGLWVWVCLWIYTKLKAHHVLAAALKQRELEKISATDDG
ncbi:MAG TPA: phosphatase PAP2 family protein [Ktedonobacteraceae bacterium]|nr:phosphatase PAP2 family protein [Ktedonobacteraceae bacterium]